MNINAYSLFVIILLNFVDFNIINPRMNIFKHLFPNDNIETVYQFLKISCKFDIRHITVVKKLNQRRSKNCHLINTCWLSKSGVCLFGR